MSEDINDRVHVFIGDEEIDFSKPGAIIYDASTGEVLAKVPLTGPFPSFPMDFTAKPGDPETIRISLVTKREERKDE